VGPHKIDLSNIELKGRILDIGGGGEGLIGQFKGEQVVAIDPNRSELEEAKSTKDLKIIMDAKNLQFLDNTFDTATAFFTMMYIPTADHKKVFEEIFRVLKKDGEFVLWDLTIPNRGNNKKDIYGVRLNVKIDDKIIEPGYGVQWNKEQDMKYLSKLGKKVRFKLLKKEEEKDTFYLRFRKI
jgi:ubiquinone/menaquinone biosynthesis C-methylase UbiE